MNIKKNTLSAGLFFVLVASTISCVDSASSDKQIDKLYSHHFSVLNTINDKKTIEAALAELSRLSADLAASNSPHTSDFQYLSTLYKARVQSFQLNNPNQGFRYLASKLGEEEVNELSQNHQKTSAKCFLFDRQRHAKDLEQAFSALEKVEFIYAQKIYRMADAIKTWRKVNGNLDEKKALEHLATYLAGGICRGVAEISGQYLCEHKSASPKEIADWAEKNFATILKGAIEGKILSDLLSHGEQEFADAYNEAKEKEYAINTELPGYALKSEMKQFLKKYVLSKIPSGKSLIMEVAFRGGDTGHRTLVFITGEKFHIIDNNVGVLLFDQEDSFLDAFARYRQIFYLHAIHPDMVVFAKFC